MLLAPGAPVAIYTKPKHPDAPRQVAELAHWLEQRGHPAQKSPHENDPPASLAVVLGGDGTMLHLAPRLARTHTPAMAVHFGTLGFLTDTPFDQLYPSLEAILAGQGVLHQRALLQARFEAQDGTTEIFEALNELVVGKGDLARIITFELTVDGERVARYRADGMVVATPTGSTAYSFSAGGPVIAPGMDALVLTPICPHSLNQRPLVVSGHSEVAITLRHGASPTFLTVDGQHGRPLAAGDRVHCSRSPLTLTTVSVTPRSFYDTLRSKLRWG